MTSPTRPMACESEDDHRERAEVVQDVFGGDGLAADARFGEGHVFGNAGSRWWQTISMSRCSSMVLHGVRPGRVGGGGQHVGFAAGLDDVRRMTAAGAFGVVGVDGAALERGERGFDEAGFVQRVGVDRHLHVVSSATLRQQSIAAGVVPQSSCSLRPMAPASTCSLSASGRLALPLPRKPRFIGKASAACSMRAMCQGPGVQVVALVPVAGPVPPPIMVVTPRHQRFFDLLRADEVDVRVDAAGGDDHAFAGDDFGAGADDDVDRRLDVRDCRPCRCRRCGRP